MIKSVQNFQCGKCKYRFTPSHNYDDDPKTRNCPHCKNAAGDILYLGATGNFIGVISDDLGMKGVYSHADGQKYDSKSKYYANVKARGLEIVGNEKPKLSKEIQGNFDCRKELAAAIDQTDAVNKLKIKS